MIDSLLQDPRVTVRRGLPPNFEGRAVVYWVQRSQRGIDNPALDLAINVANELARPVIVFFGLHPRYPGANLRHYAFLIEGLAGLARDVENRGAHFVFRAYPNHSLAGLCDEVKPCVVIGDENPLRAPESWRRSAAGRIKAPLWTVDADVVVPTKLYAKEEYAARTLRPKIHRVIDVFLQPSSNPIATNRLPQRQVPVSQSIDIASLLETLPLDRSVSPVARIRGGAGPASECLRRFVNERLANYDQKRNLPHVDGTSELSPYLHFGQICPITIALAVRKSSAPETAKAAFLEELIVRRELAINYVTRNPNYDLLAGSPSWARAALARHAEDARPHIYTATQLESADTH